MPEVKVTMTPKQYATLRDPKVFLHTEFGIPTSNNIEETLWTRFLSRIEARGQGHSDPKKV